MATAFLLIAMVTINDHLQSSFYNISVSFGSTTAYNTHIYIYTYTDTHTHTHTHTHTEESKAIRWACLPRKHLCTTQVNFESVQKDLLGSRTDTRSAGSCTMPHECGCGHPKSKLSPTPPLLHTHTHAHADMYSYMHI